MAKSSHPISLLLVIALSSLCPWPTASQAIVKHLPGFPGCLPFYLETGYIGVGELDEDQLFYYFIESQNNPKTDPIMLWLTGGPGCSSFGALAYEIGPLNFKNEEYNGSVPTLQLRLHSWNKIFSIIYVDSPVGTGFSYTTGPTEEKIGDIRAAEDLYEFIRKWLMAHPQFASNHLYLGGDSYSGIIIPFLAEAIANGIEAKKQPIFTFKGYLLGNPLTDYTIDDGSFVPFAHGMNLIPAELYELTKKSCSGNYVHPCSPECEKDIEAVKQCLAGLNVDQILEKKCPPDSLPMMAGGRRSLQQLEPYPHPWFGCRTYWLLLSYYWANDASVKEALHIREGTNGEWIRCNHALPYLREIMSTIKYHISLTTRGYRALIYSGDHDLRTPFVGTETWIRDLNFSTVDEWRPWTVDGQVAGYTKKYTNNITFATVKGAGHRAPEDKPKECLAMVERWIANKPL